MADDPKKPENPLEGLPWDEDNFEASLDSLFDGVIDSSQLPPPISSQESIAAQEGPQKAPEEGAAAESSSPNESTASSLEEDEATSVAVMPSLVPGGLSSGPLPLPEDEEKTTVGDPSFFLPEISPDLAKGAPPRLPLPPSLTRETKGPRLPLPAAFRDREEAPRSAPPGEARPRRPYEAGTPPYGSHLSGIEAKPERTPPYGAHVRLPLPPSLTGEGRTSFLSPRAAEPLSEEKTATMRFGPPAAPPLEEIAPALSEEVLGPLWESEEPPLSPAFPDQEKPPRDAGFSPALKSAALSPPLTETLQAKEVRSDKAPSPPVATDAPPRPEISAPSAQERRAAPPPPSAKEEAHAKGTPPRPVSGAAAALARFRAKEKATSGPGPARLPLPPLPPGFTPPPFPVTAPSAPQEAKQREQGKEEVKEAKTSSPVPAKVKEPNTPPTAAPAPEGIILADAPVSESIVSPEPPLIDPFAPREEEEERPKAAPLPAVPAPPSEKEEKAAPAPPEEKSAPEDPKASPAALAEEKAGPSPREIPEDDLLGILFEEKPPPVSRRTPPPVPPRLPPAPPREGKAPPLPSEASLTELLGGASDVALPPDREDVARQEEAPAPSLPSPSLSLEEAAREDMALLEEELLQEGDARSRGALAFEIGRLADEVLGEVETARTWYEKALRIDPSHRLAARALRAIAERTQDKHAALDALKRELSATSSPAEQAALLLDVAALWQRLGSQEEERAALKRALELAPGDACVLQEWLYATYRAGQWDEFIKAALAFARQPEAGALAGALLWEAGWIEETRRQDPAAAEQIFALAEEMGEDAATRARMRLLLRRNDTAEAARLAAKRASAQNPEAQQDLALACLRAPREVAALLLKEAQLPPSLIGALAKIASGDSPSLLAEGYTSLASHLSASRSQGALLAVSGLLGSEDQKATKLALSSAQSLLGEERSLCWVQASLHEGDEVTQLLSPVFPGLLGLLKERYTKDPEGALLAFAALLAENPADTGIRYEALRLGLILGRPEALFDALFGKLEALPPEERPLRAIELMEIALSRGEAEKVDAVIASAAQEGAPGAAALRAAWAGIQSPEHRAERGAAYVSAAEAISEPWARGALLAHAAMYLEEAGDLARAWDALSRSILARPAHTPTREAALHLAAKARDHVGYRTLREGELALAIEAGDRQKAAALSFDIAALLEEQGEHETAMARYLAALEHWPGHAPSVQALSRLAAVVKDWEAYAEALALLAEQRRHEPAAQASAFLLAGEVYDNRLNYPEFAREALVSAREVNPNLRAAIRAEEALLWRTGDAAALFELYQKEWEKSPAPQQAEHALRLARLAADRGMFDESIRWYREVLKQPDPHPVALFGMERSALSRERWPELCEAYERLSQTRSSPEEIAACEINLIALRRKAGVGADSLPAHYTRLFEAAPEAPLAQRLALTDRRVRKDLLGEASAYEMIARVAGDDHARALWKTRAGEALRRANDLAAAKEAFAAALSFAPDYLPALWGQAEVAREQNDLSTELSALSRLGEHLADPKEAGKILQRTAELAARANPDGEEARRLLWKALSRDPKNLEAFTQLRSSLSPSSREDAQALRQILEKRLAVASAKERPPLLRELASLCLERLDDPDGAQAALRELVKTENPSYQTLVDLALLEEKQGDYQEAAELFIRILRLPKLTPQQKRDAYWHLALIYDEHIPDLHRARASYQHVLSIGGAAEREAGFRLAQIRAKGGEHLQAIDLFNRVALNEPDTRARIRCYLRTARFWSELGDLNQAVAAALRALALDEHDLEVIEELARLYQRKNDKRARSIHLGRAALSFCSLLHANPGNLETYQALVKIFRLMEDQARTACAAMLYTALGGKDPEIQGLARQSSFYPLPPERFSDTELKEKIRHPDALPGLRALLPMIGDTLLRKIFPPELRRHGVSVQDRVMNGPVFQAAQLFGRPLGVPQVALYAQRLSPHVAAVEHTAPPAAVFGSTMLGDLSEEAVRFLVARSLYLIGQGPLFAASLGPVDLRDILFGVAIALQVPLEIQKTPQAEEIARVVGPALMRKDPTLASSLVGESLPGGDFSGEKFSQGIRHEANRAALLLVGSPRAALEALVRLHGGHLPAPGERLPDSVVRAPEIVELVQFLLSEEFVSVRG